MPRLLGPMTAAASLAAVLSAISPDAQAQQSVAGSDGARGARWRADAISLSVDDSIDELGAFAFEAVIQAVTAWQLDSEVLPTLVVKRGKADVVGYRPGQQNQNTVRFVADGDPMANGALAITVITFDADAGEILDADIILNGEHRFALLAAALDESEGVYDVQNVLTHETGHMLGLGEDYANANATMYAYSLPGEIIKREIESSDQHAIHDLYSLEPRAGCGGATMSGHAARQGTWIWASFVAMTALFSARRRARRAAASATLVALLGIVCLLAPGSHRIDIADSGYVVTQSEARWEDALIVTKLGLRPADCESSCPEFETEVLGGRVGSLEQVVGHLRTPLVGEALTSASGQHFVRTQRTR